MEWFPASKDHLPLTWWKQTPVYLAAVIALAGVASMVVTALIMAINPEWALMFAFDAPHFLGGRVWTPLTYVFVNPPDIWLLLTSYCLYSFGAAIEQHLGRRVFVKLLLCLLLVTPLLLTSVRLLGLLDFPAFLTPVSNLCVILSSLVPTFGIRPLELGVFVAFATLYPSARISLIIVSVEAWMLAVAFVGVSALEYMAHHLWTALFVLAGQTLTAVVYTRYEQGLLQLPAFLTRPKRTSPSKPKPSVQRDARKPAGGAKILDLSDVDDILEKISRHGIASLTEAEKRTLEQASDKLGKRRQ